ncbi:MAG: hypothetical protein K0R71_921 [Bacillales bacterium]|nr:hypothetical protein [Bacillales bacterium]
MGIIDTYEWLDKAKSTKDIETKILKHLHITDTGFIGKLYQHGLTKFNRSSKIIFYGLKEKKVWEQTEMLLQKYKKIWHGPDVPVFIFPARGSLFAVSKKSGVAFQKALFLFVPAEITEKELEVIFVHEYHHVCRLHYMKNHNESTLLDTVIMEGLAEKAVEEYCGKNFVAPWTIGINKKDLDELIFKIYKPNFKIKKTDTKHDAFIYGTNGIPKMAGYAVGYYLVKEYEKEKKLNTFQMLPLPSTKFLKK